MKLIVNNSQINGSVKIPGSKSHTIRALIIASLANGQSHIKEALISEDTKSCINVIKALGAKVEVNGTDIFVEGFGDKPRTSAETIDVGNSGTTLNIALGIASVLGGKYRFTGDYQIQRRPIYNLINSLNDLGAKVLAEKNNGCPPVTVEGKLVGGKTTMKAITSQYLTSILMSAPLAKLDSEVDVSILNEAPYVEMTLWWLQKQGIEISYKDLMHYKIKGNQKYKPFELAIPGDFSSATFFAVLASISGGEITLTNLDMRDPQGDKNILRILEKMGSEIFYHDDTIVIRGKDLEGIDIDMNSIPDALPAMAVAGCFAKGTTRLLNVPQARLKETDRIKVMCEELRKMGADIEELPDGLLVRRSRLRGTFVEGHDDHRVVMSLAIAGMLSEGETTINSAEAMDVTFPEFLQLAKSCGGKLRCE